MAYRLGVSWYRCQIFRPQVIFYQHNSFFFNSKTICKHKICFIFRVPEYQKLNDLTRKYFTTEFHDEQANEEMKFYISAGIKDVVFLMKTPYGKYE